MHERMVAPFLAQMEDVMAAHRGSCIVNLDEISWRLMSKQISTTVDIAADEAECLFEGDQKMCLTALANVDAAGGKSPSLSCAKASGPVRGVRP
jgi:hypothetical protein